MNLARQRWKSTSNRKERDLGSSNNYLYMFSECRCSWMLVQASAPERAQMASKLRDHIHQTSVSGNSCHLNDKACSGEQIAQRPHKGTIKLRDRKIHTPDEWIEIENADKGAHLICDRTAPLIVIRESTGSAPTARIWSDTNQTKRKKNEETMSTLSGSQESRTNG
jgi:hypothetical protein